MQIIVSNEEVIHKNSESTAHEAQIEQLNMSTSSFGMDASSDLSNPLLENPATGLESIVEAKRTFGQKVRSVFKKRKISSSPSTSYVSASSSSSPAIRSISDNVKSLKDSISSLTNKIDDLHFSYILLRFLKEEVASLGGKIDSLVLTKSNKSNSETSNSKLILLRDAKSIM